MFGVVPGNLQPNTPTESQLMSSTVINRIFGFADFALELKPGRHKKLARKERKRIRILVQLILPGRNLGQNGFKVSPIQKKSASFATALVRRVEYVCAGLHSIR